MWRRLYENFLLVSFCCTAVIAAGSSELLRQENCGGTFFPSAETDTNKVRLQDYPWIAALKYKVRSATEPKIRCTGTLISKRYILTGAMCATNSSKLVEATLGSTEKGAPPPQAFNISYADVTLHPNYTFPENNIALIRLPKDVDDSIAPICLPIQDDARNNLFKRNLTVAGWFFNPWGEMMQLSTEFEKASVPVVPNARCAEKFAELANINEKYICAGGATSPDACKRFAGSPLSDEVILDGVIKTVQYGISSFAVTGCNNKSKEYPRVYTRISAYIDWILDNIKA